MPACREVAEKLPGYAIVQKLLADVVKIRHAFVRC